ncbi:uncharacterized protein F4812DRAFT_452742 [Daldinia caldariorum]|uniref:uncharacterized protein n=1 Tax=Daldinia caldariorum TaxID=326644 RepID=UPI0020074DA7|nr:uncharacterized protein F4812DRAFT_452742 [Daldinia caldariorum]KAI1464659.1 hypothetical protein F4812DRAFT_452742 [Daldinia caldariorum]
MDSEEVATTSNPSPRAAARQQFSIRYLEPRGNKPLIIYALPVTATADPSASSLLSPNTTTTTTTTTTATTATTPTTTAIATATATTTTASTTAIATNSAANNSTIITTTTPTTTTITAPPTPSKCDNFHEHRQSHSSSKLPTFRFADLKREHHITIPSLLQSHHIPPSPVSPDPDQHSETQPNTAQDTSPLTAHQQYNNSNNSDNIKPVLPEQLPVEKLSPSRSRASTFQTPAAQSIATSTSSINAKRSASLDSTITATHKRTRNTIGAKSPTDSKDAVVIVQSRHQRAPFSGDSAIENSPERRMHVSHNSQSTSTREETSKEETTKEGAQWQRELILPKTIQRTAADDRRNSIVRRPPVSYKPPVNSTSSGGTTSIPPIRSFRSSGERRSLVLDMNLRSMRGYEPSEESGDSNHRDRTLRALEGRRLDDASQITPPDSAGDRPDGDDNGDLFLKIAREDPSRSRSEVNGSYGDNQSALSRVARSSRRPLSVAVSTSFNPSSPPQMARRLSDQEASRSRGFGDDQSGEKMPRTITFKGVPRDKADDTKPRSGSALRGSPLTPRSLAFQDLPSDQGSAYSRKRQASVDGGSALPSRMSSLKQSNVNYSHPRTYNSSPLVPKPAESQKQDAQLDDPNHGVEGTNSTTSTAAPSTVWDELDDLKSRIHRLELTGKLPPTSGAAISRASDERPPTAHTNATTLSASPKRGPGGAAQASDANNAQKDGHPLLTSALTKSKDFLSAEVYEALETAANDALALSMMMGTAGQPGPISSGASSIGSGTTITDRQLRRKADSICRSLTELCLALSEGAAQLKPPSQPQVAPPTPENPLLASPNITKFQGIAAQRRQSVADRNLTVNTSPRTIPRFEERRNMEERRNSTLGTTFLSSALPTPRFSSTTPATPTETTMHGPSRKTSLLISRSRRAGSEDPDEARKSSQSSLLRLRRATTEEPEDLSDRKPVLTRARQGTVNRDDEEGQFRAPSRAITEVHGLRSGTREYASQLAPPPKEPEPLATSALPKRRLASALSSRLVIPTSTSGFASTARRYFDRSTPDRDTYNAEKSEDRQQRQFSMSRSGSMDKRTNRASMIATSSPATGGYR